MLIPKKNRLQVYKHLFTEGVMCAKDAPNAPKHHEMDLPNLQIMKLLQSLESRGYCKKMYSWRWYYYYLTNEGVAYLREYLGNISENVIPKTQMKQAAAPRLAPAPSTVRAAVVATGPSATVAASRVAAAVMAVTPTAQAPPVEGGFGRGFNKEGGAPGSDMQPSFRAGAGRAARAPPS
eukprot:CAMPEP_0114544974 /NCGR_PEP_ID=MMETSP0114-20121206/3156_1 /TAXON_ID=31324 /ORGANISM="Goniomonas sp, Strain m" /LENGTH=178 /DNA_ID=CAMNT_0001729377 /DNA_START=44 /DNA_END=581 /DNA_ORIENTATION=-